MHLYDKKDKAIHIYSFEADKEALIEYRKKILEGQDINQLFYIFETTNETIKNRFVRADELDIRFLEQEDKSRDASGWWSELKQEKSSSKSNQVAKEEVLIKYINGDFSQVIPTKTFIPDEGVDCYLKSFLVTSKPTSIYSNVEKRNYFKLENLISLPSELCALQLLENGRFSQILGTWLDFSESLKLFSAEQVDSISVEEMQKMFNYGLLDGTYEETMRNVDTTQKILQRMKKNINCR